jgi:hypothetical protein
MSQEFVSTNTILASEKTGSDSEQGIHIKLNDIGVKLTNIGESVKFCKYYTKELSEKNDKNNYNIDKTHQFWKKTLKILVVLLIAVALTVLILFSSIALALYIIGFIFGSFITYIFVKHF